MNDLARLAAQQAAELASMARAQGEQVLADGKRGAAQQLSAVGGAVRRAADKLYDQDSNSLAEYVDSAADRVEQVARAVDERDLSELAKDAEALARRKPIWFLGAMFVAGVASAQLLRAMTVTIDTAPPLPDGDTEPTDPSDA